MPMPPQPPPPPYPPGLPHPPQWGQQYPTSFGRGKGRRGGGKGGGGRGRGGHPASARGYNSNSYGGPPRGSGGANRGRGGRGNASPPAENIEAYFSPLMLSNPWSHLERQHLPVATAAGQGAGEDGRLDKEGILDRPWH
jgi:hypothetical protein